jgi:hypothetical protein
VFLPQKGNIYQDVHFVSPSPVYVCAKLDYRITEQQKKKEYRKRPHAAPDLRIQLSSIKKENCEEREESHSSYRNLQICGIFVFKLIFRIYCEGIAQGIAGQQSGGHVPAHAPRNNTVEVLSSCPRMGRCYTTYVR